MFSFFVLLQIVEIINNHNHGECTIVIGSHNPPPPRKKTQNKIKTNKLTPGHENKYNVFI